MQQSTFIYPFSARLIYRYGVIPANLLLLGYLLPFMFAFQWLKFFYAVILALALYLLNSYFFNFVKCVPYRIEVAGDKIKCSNYFLSGKVTEFSFSDITDIKGGVFTRGNAGLFRVYVAGLKHEIIFFRMLKNNQALQNLLLGNIRKELYEEIMVRIGISKKLRNI